MTVAADLETSPVPTWPAAPGPLVFLLDVSGKHEYEILKAWVADHRPDEAEEPVLARIPASRRANKHRPDPRLGARLAQDDDPLMVPLRVVWLATEEDGRRRVRLQDVLAPGDPRDPGPLRQRWIRKISPDRCRIIMGEPALKSTLSDRWRDPAGHGPVDGTSLEEYVALQAWLALERAERRLRGSRYKVPKFLREDLYWSKGFQRGAAGLAMELGKPLKRMQSTTARYLKEMAATHSPYAIDVVTGITGGIISMAHRSVDYDPETFTELYELSQQHALVFLPSHKSNFDHLVLSYVMYENGLPQNHTAGGLNMNFFPVGQLLRRTGIFFIRREFKDNKPYKYVLRKYLEYLLEKRFALEWYVEGGRSRTGKLREPHLGLLAYVAEAYTAGIVDDVVLIPVSITYDQITDVRSYAREQRGGAKERESFLWAAKFIANARTSHGSIYLRFGAPLPMSDHLVPGADLTAGEGRLAVPRLAFDVSTQINAVTPITPTSLACLALLEARRSLTGDEAAHVIAAHLAYIASHDLPTAVALDDPPAQLGQALGELAGTGVVTADEDDADRVVLGHEEVLAAAYYRNTIVHHFLNRAIAEVATTLGRDDRAAAFDGALGLRDLLKFDFFFPPRKEFLARIEQEMGHTEPTLAGSILKPFLDPYLVVANALENQGTRTVESEALTEHAFELGSRFATNHIIAPEAVSGALFSAAVKLARHRGLLTAGVAEREAFAVEVRRYLAAL